MVQYPANGLLTRRGAHLVAFFPCSLFYETSSMSLKLLQSLPECKETQLVFENLQKRSWLGREKCLKAEQPQRRQTNPLFPPSSVLPANFRAVMTLFLWTTKNPANSPYRFSEKKAREKRLFWGPERLFTLIQQGSSFLRFPSQLPPPSLLLFFLPFFPSFFLRLFRRRVLVFVVVLVVQTVSLPFLPQAGTQQLSPSLLLPLPLPLLLSFPNNTTHPSLPLPLLLPSSLSSP